MWAHVHIHFYIQDYNSSMWEVGQENNLSYRGQPGLHETLFHPLLPLPKREDGDKRRKNGWSKIPLPFSFKPVMN